MLNHSPTSFICCRHSVRYFSTAKKMIIMRKGRMRSNMERSFPFFTLLLSSCDWTEQVIVHLDRLQLHCSLLPSCFFFCFFSFTRQFSQDPFLLLALGRESCCTSTVKLVSCPSTKTQVGNLVPRAFPL